MKLDKEQCQSLYDSGMTLDEIASRFNTHKMTLQRLGLKLRTTSESRRLRGTNKQTDNAKMKLSAHAIENGLGGRVYHRIFPYKGIKFDSSYELELAKDLDANNIPWIRPKRLKWIDDNGKQRHYTPDFYLPKQNIYLDPKNDFLIEKDKRKIQLVSEQNQCLVLVLNKSQLSWHTIASMV